MMKLYDTRLQFERVTSRLKGNHFSRARNSVGADLIRVGPNQLKCMRLFGEGRKHISDFPEDLRPTVYGLVKGGFVEKSFGEEEAKRKVYGRRLVCKITEKGQKVLKALKTLQAL